MFRYLISIVLVLMVACGGKDSKSDKPSVMVDPKPLQGILQFQVRHNLAHDACLAEGNCFLHTEASAEGVSDWLSGLREHSNLAVLHWDRSIPWQVFNQDVAPGATMVEFYDARIDPDLLRWLSAFVVQFESMAHGYLAVSILHGERNRLQKMALDSDPQHDVELSGACPTIQPGSLFEVDYEQGGTMHHEQIDIENAYSNFLLYLYAKLRPEYLALMVESNLYREMCAPQWPGLVSLYHQLYDRLKSQVDPQTRLFSTLTLQHLLRYDLDTCYPHLSVSACGQTASFEPYQPGAVDQCYPVDASPVQELDQGDRLDLLALSFYPDSLTFAPGTEDSTLYIYDETWDGLDNEDCTVQVRSPPYVDPWSGIDRLNWSKPIAIAETSARSCRTYIWKADDTESLIIRPASDANTQAFWLETLLSQAREHRLEFFVQSFLQDYDPLGLWVVRENVLPPSIYSLFNLWSCSGLIDRDGQAKSRLLEIWQPD
jgi:hypothetical protein